MKAFSAEAAGNRFVLIDCVAGDAPADPAALALRCCAQPDSNGFRPDGVLLCLPGPESDGDGVAVGMALYNRDGSRPEACGNGLRLVALMAAQMGYGRGDFQIVTDAGLRQVRVDETGVEVCLGPVVIDAQEHLLEMPGLCLSGVRVSVGNPHFILFSSEDASPRIEEYGALIATHESFPRGTNVAFVEPIEPQAPLVVRIHERGVGETGACGTGAAAVAYAAVARGWAQWPVEVQLRGGLLLLDERSGGVWLKGPTEILGPWDCSY